MKVCTLKRKLKTNLARLLRGGASGRSILVNWDSRFRANSSFRVSAGSAGTRLCVSRLLAQTTSRS